MNSKEQAEGKNLTKPTFSQVSGSDATNLSPKVNNTLYWTNKLIKDNISPLIDLPWKHHLAQTETKQQALLDYLRLCCPQKITSINQERIDYIDIPNTLF